MLSRCLQLPNRKVECRKRATKAMAAQKQADLAQGMTCFSLQLTNFEEILQEVSFQSLHLSTFPCSPQSMS